MSNTFQVNTSKNFDIIVTEDQTFDPVFIFVDNEGNSVDLSGAIAKLIVTEIAYDACVQCEDIGLEFTPTLTGVNNNKLQFNDTITIPGDVYNYEIILLYPTGIIKSILNGKFKVRQNSTGGGGGGSLGYSVYSAMLSQAGTGAPTATVLENTIGNIVWTRDSIGLYNGTLNGAFTAGKTILPPFGNFTGFNTSAMPISDFTQAPIGYYTAYDGGSTNHVQLFVTNAEGASVDLETLLGTNGNIFIEIRVYQ